MNSPDGNTYTVIHQELSGEESTTFCGSYFDNFKEANEYAYQWAIDQWGKGNFDNKIYGLYVFYSEYIKVYKIEQEWGQIYP